MRGSTDDQMLVRNRQAAHLPYNSCKTLDANSYCRASAPLANSLTPTASPNGCVYWM